MIPTTEPTLAKWAGRLSIPYLSPAGVLNLKFRSLDGSDPKYLCLPNARPLLFNVMAFQSHSPVIGICEGEMDALTLTHEVGLPAVAVPGVSTWQKHFGRCFTGYERVLVFQDGDPAGKDLAKRIARDLPQVQVIECPSGEDVNSLFVSEGADGLRKRAGLD